MSTKVVPSKFSPPNMRERLLNVTVNLYLTYQLIHRVNPNLDGLAELVSHLLHARNGLLDLVNATELERSRAGQWEGP